MDGIGVIFAIQRFSVHDGPGIRTTVFLKGCPLRCVWCQNPEGLDAGINLRRFDNLCVRCGRCIAVCPAGALRSDEDGAPRIDHDACIRCGKCVDECGRNALAMDGRELSVTDLVSELTKDRVFFAASGGGVTFSGGEPLMQAGFVAETAERLKGDGIATAIETCLEADWRTVEGLLPCMDFFQIDVKLADSLRHTAATGRDNARLLDNFRRLACMVTADRLRVKIPLVPGYTADAENLRGVAGIVSRINPDIPIELLNFNPLALAKYRRMPEMEYSLAEAKPFSDDEMQAFRKIIGALARVV